MIAMENSRSPASATALDALRADGFHVIRRALEPSIVAGLDLDLAPAFERTPFGVGPFYGAHTKRFGRLLRRSSHAATFVQNAEVLAIVDAILSPWCDCFQLNTAQAIAVHPGAPAQLPHRDQDMWRAPSWIAEYLVNIIWPLTPFRSENGATRLWPKSHGDAALEDAPDDDGISVDLEPGDALVILGSTLHGAGANRSGTDRRAVVIGYALGWLKPYENQWLAYPPDVARTFSPELAALIGYRQHRPNLGNYEGQCPSILLHGDADASLGAVDALRPDQAAAVLAHAEAQRCFG